MTLRKTLLGVLLLVLGTAPLLKAGDDDNVTWGQEDWYRASRGIYTVQIGIERLSDGKYRHWIKFREKGDGNTF